MRRCLQRGTGWPREPLEMQVSNVRNLLAQLNSVYEAGKLWEKHYIERKYSAVMFARPDVQFSCPFPAHLLQVLQVSRTHHADVVGIGCAPIIRSVLMSLAQALFAFEDASQTAQCVAKSEAWLLIWLVIWSHNGGQNATLPEGQHVLPTR